MKVVAKLDDFVWRPLTASEPDTDFVLRLRNDERFRDKFYSTKITPEMHRKFVESADARGEINWIVERKGEPIGVSSIYHIDKENRKAECGRIVSLVPRMFLLNFVVCMKVAERMNLNRLYTEALESNTIIAKAMERFGMRQEGLLRGHIIRDGVPLNVRVFGATTEDWVEHHEEWFARYGEPEIISYEP